MIELSIVQKITVWALPLIFAITLHEVAHGYVASLFGDHTAKLMGRLSLNPLQHIDVIGTIVVPLLMLAFTPFIFGWAKPVPVDPRNLQNPRRDMALVALAGPLSNLLMALIWAAMSKLGILLLMNGYLWVGRPLTYMGYAGVGINVMLAVLNILPIPPLDGSKFFGAIFPGKFVYRFSALQPYSFLILLILLVTGVLSGIIMPIANTIIQIIANLFQLR